MLSTHLATHLNHADSLLVCALLIKMCPLMSRPNKGTMCILLPVLSSTTMMTTHLRLYQSDDTFMLIKLS